MKELQFFTIGFGAYVTVTLILQESDLSPLDTAEVALQDRALAEDSPAGTHLSL